MEVSKDLSNIDLESCMCFFGLNAVVFLRFCRPKLEVFIRMKI